MPRTAAVVSTAVAAASAKEMLERSTLTLALAMLASASLFLVGLPRRFQAAVSKLYRFGMSFAALASAVVREEDCDTNSLVVLSERSR